MKISIFKILLVSIFLIGCSSSPEIIDEIIDNEDEIDVPIITSKPNILLVIADDVSKDAIANYTEGSIKANMPNLESLMSKGITFNNAWSYSVCTRIPRSNPNKI
ncbi:sulfatase-like hydrolase/transferase [Polaribacter ponticola]|uniref:Sulfatase-like hydrolase/transferase n=1 Tax=Polaribacter ponticola TaxID=2978475 RepID=A0ABT5S4E8_9FLAO|nr:sulfatase-like hydrolase/transferase [Polaribacter sp. MSW5]MDD7912983.1 sulfatase-like hydrolase/transferase [Polaribacter sp. MSW5]